MCVLSRFHTDASLAGGNERERGYPTFGSSSSRGVLVQVAAKRLQKIGKCKGICRYNNPRKLYGCMIEL